MSVRGLQVLNEVGDAPHFVAREGRNLATLNPRRRGSDGAAAAIADARQNCASGSIFEGAAAIAGDTSAATAAQVIPDSLVLAEIYARAHLLDLLPRNRADGR